MMDVKINMYSKCFTWYVGVISFKIAATVVMFDIGFTTF